MERNKISVLVIGSGGREHALVWKIVQSKRIGKIFCAPGNAGTAKLAENVPIATTDFKQLLSFAKKNGVALTVVGPETPLVEGIADLFRKNKLAIVGPSKKASRIESSKIFAKKLMLEYKIPTAESVVFNNFAKAKKYLISAKYPLVVKADGLCSGKGVSVCASQKEAVGFLKQLMIDKIFDDSGKKVLIEECLTGLEVSYMVLSDGKHHVSLLSSQDHKRVFDDDQGPNTGGMGAYAPVPFVTKKLGKTIDDRIITPILAAMAKENCPYQGILYPGLILTADGPKVLEFNCRFGDPEIQPLMMLLKNDLLELFQALLNKKLHRQRVTFRKGSAICVILASKGYPGHYEKGEKIFGLEKNYGSNIIVFHAGTTKKNGHIVTNGGRVLGITAYGQNLKTAIKNVYSVIGKKAVNFQNMHYRTDIGEKALL